MGAVQLHCICDKNHVMLQNKLLHSHQLNFNAHNTKQGFVTMCRHCIRNSHPGSSKTLRKGCFEDDEEGKATQFSIGQQTKVRKRNARMRMGGSEKREKEGLWLSWKELIQQTALEEEQLRDLMLSQYSYASIPYKNKRQVASAEGDSQEKEQEKVQAVQVDETLTPSLLKDRKA